MRPGKNYIFDLFVSGRLRTCIFRIAKKCKNEGKQRGKGLKSKQQQKNRQITRIVSQHANNYAHKCETDSNDEKVHFHSV